MTDTPNLKCSYSNGPCVGMTNHSYGSHTYPSRKGGIYALNNRTILNDPKLKMFHMGFVLRPSPHPDAGKAGVLLNFCPWCGADLREWYEEYQDDIESYKKTL